MNARAQEIADDVVETEVEPTLRETIEAARDEVVERHDTELVAAGETPTGRDASGRFTKREAEAAEAPAVAQAAPMASAVATAQPPPPESTALLAPNSWTPAAKAKWAALDPELRAEINRREQEVHKTIARQDEERQIGNQFNTLSQQHQAVIQRSGVPPIRIFQDFLGIMGILQGTDMAAKAAVVRDVARLNGLDLRAVVGQAPNVQAPSQPGATPPQAVIPPEIQQMHREWEARKQQDAAQAQQRTQQQERETYDEIVAFRSKPEARFFDAVQPHMIGLLSSGAATSLEEAYNAAIWARPDIRDILQKEAAAAAAVTQASRQRAQQARVKSGSVRGGSGSVTPGAPDRTLREELQHNLAEARASRV